MIATLDHYLLMEVNNRSTAIVLTGMWRNFSISMTYEGILQVQRVRMAELGIKLARLMGDNWSIYLMQSSAG